MSGCSRRRRLNCKLDGLDGEGMVYCAKRGCVGFLFEDVGAACLGG